MTNALLRLSRSVSRIQKEMLVTDIIEELASLFLAEDCDCWYWMQGLTECANVLVGSEKDDIKGISGGQIRRLAIGLELVTRPSVIVLDEPTSGLDSEIALTTMLTLKALADNHRTVGDGSTEAIVANQSYVCRWYAASISQTPTLWTPLMTFTSWHRDGVCIWVLGPMLSISLSRPDSSKPRSTVNALRMCTNIHHGTDARRTRIPQTTS